MLGDLLNKDVQDFINTHLKSNISKLILKGSPFESVTIQDIARQIEAKIKCEKKLPTWYSATNIIYPNKVSIEQSSSEITAKFKASLLSGKTIIDLTGGFGVDAYYFSKRFKEVVHCETNEVLSKYVAYNYRSLNNDNIKCLAIDGIAFIKSNSTRYDCIYADPSRRSDQKGKVFLLDDCLPNIPKHLDALFEKTDQILLKLSPVLDLKDTIDKLKFVKSIHIVAIKNEVKEVLYYMKKDYLGPIELATHNFSTKNNQRFNFQYGGKSTATYSSPKAYIYEPNAAILKSGGFQEVSTQFKIAKLHLHSHLYTSNKLISFPGRVFKVNHVVFYSKKQLKKTLSVSKANITTRNFPETVTQIRKKTGIKDGGNTYLLFTTNLENKPIVLICEKLS